MMRCAGARRRRDGIPRCDVTWAGTGARPYETGAGMGAPPLRGLLVSACGLGGAFLVA
jgi:hypothetical protein